MPNLEREQMDLYRLLVDRLHEAAAPDAAAREAVYQDCRETVARASEDPDRRELMLATLEKIIRRQEMQAIYKEALRANAAGDT